MKIIKEGLSDWRDEYRFTCRLCRCVFVASYGEYEILHDQREQETIAFCPCPNCGVACHSTAVENKQLNFEIESNGTSTFGF